MNYIEEESLKLQNDNNYLLEKYNDIYIKLLNNEKNTINEENLKAEALMLLTYVYYGKNKLSLEEISLGFYVLASKIMGVN